MTDILTRLRDAPEDDEYSVLNEAINLAGEKDWISEAQWLQAEKWLNVGAFVDAALTLVPETLGMEIVTYTSGEAKVTRIWSTTCGLGISSVGNTLALALCIAALKARMAKEDDGGSTRAEVAEAVGFDDPYDHGQCNRADDPA